jgi:hypothetical protein
VDTTPQVELDKMLRDLLNLEEGLTGWEMQFVESLYEQDSRSWTEKQITKLKQIAEERL